MSIHTEIITRALNEKSAEGHPLWQYHDSYEPALEALEADGKAVRLRLDALQAGSESLSETVRREALVLTGWYLPEAAVARLEREAWNQERWASFPSTHPTTMVWCARYATHLRSMAAKLAASIMEAS
ncbi:MAG: hypothetical protein WC563_16290 [Brevundimonas sp.]